ncbi:MAG: flagellar motor switch protein FliG [Rhodobacter sp.]|jgi:flagellar motor switch protein FliG|nr:flagellar motor switch protein FliG [Rhodobacter sp.]
MSNALATIGGMPSNAVSTKSGANGQPSRQPESQKIHSLSREQKAAVIVRLLSSESDLLPIGGLEAKNMARLVHAMAGMSFVDEATTLQIVQEFLAEFDSFALYFKSGLSGAISTLDKYLNQEVRSLLSTSPDPEAPHDPWFVVSAMEARILAQVLMHETPQVTAIVLSKLTATIAAEVLIQLDTNQARAATLAAVKIDHVSLETIQQIGGAIEQAAARLGRKGALAGTPVDRVGAILNFTPGAMREDMLDNLNTAAPDLAEQIRRVMFTFGDIPDRVELKDVPKLVRAVDNKTLVTALAGALVSQKEAAEFIFANMSKRLSQQLAEEVKEIGDVKPKDADAAMTKVIQGIRELEIQGELFLISPEE